MNQPNGDGAPPRAEVLRIEIIYDPTVKGQEMRFTWPHHRPLETVGLLAMAQAHVVGGSAHQKKPIVTPADLVFPQGQRQ